MIELPAHPPSMADRAIDIAARACAVLGGAALVALTLMSVTSIGSRALIGRPLQGDFELVQVGCAVCIASFLPYTQKDGGNIIVGFFTDGLNPSIRAALDAIGALLLAAVMALIAWRTVVGAIAMKASGETTMIMGLPIWYGYALMVPGLALTAVVAVHSAWQDWRRV